MYKGDRYGLMVVIRVWGTRKPARVLRVSHFEIREDMLHYRLTSFGGWRVLPAARIAMIYTKGGPAHYGSTPQ